MQQKHLHQLSVKSRLAIHEQHLCCLLNKHGVMVFAWLHQEHSRQPRFRSKA